MFISLFKFLTNYLEITFWPLDFTAPCTAHKSRQQIGALYGKRITTQR